MILVNLVNLTDLVMLGSLVKVSNFIDTTVVIMRDWHESDARLIENKEKVQVEKSCWLEDNIFSNSAQKYGATKRSYKMHTLDTRGKRLM